MLAREYIRSMVPLMAVAMACLLAIESAIRIILPQPYLRLTSAMWEEDPRVRFRMVPGARGEISGGYEFRHSVSVNSLGMRGPEIGPRKDGEFRILALGDSFTFGHGVAREDVYVEQLARDLNSESSSVEFVALNGAVSGYGPVDELKWLEAYGLPLKPDLVLVGVCLGNDLKDAMAETATEAVSADVPEAAERRGISRFLFLHSHLYRLATRATPLKVRLALGLDEPFTVTYVRDAIEYHEEPPTGKAFESRRLIRSVFERLVGLSDEHDFQIAAVLIPNDYHVVPELWERMSRYGGLEPDAYSPEVSARYFGGMLKSLGIPTLDLSPHLSRALQDGQAIHYKYDLHWTPLGHRMAAEALRPFLHKEGLLSGRG